ncbi:MAG TPA: AAA family ATPase [Planctomycetota bacterium]|nr:AAA family ATPase [Planctomycetota bacterium]
MALTTNLPPWANELAQIYQGGAVNTFLLHGNVNDREALREDQALSFVSLKEFLIRAMFPRREAIICYDQAAGIWFPKNEMREDFARVVKAIDTVQGTNFTEKLPREPAKALPLIERYLRTRIADKPGFGAAVIIDYAHFIAPASLGYNFSQDDATCLISLHKWSSDPAFTKADVTITLITENLADLHPLLVRSPYTAKIHIPLPEPEQRLEYLKTALAPGELERISTLSADEISVHTAGLSRVNIDQLISRGKSLTDEAVRAAARKGRKAFEVETAALPFPRLDLDTLFEEKKDLIEKECFGLLEFLKPKRGLDSLSGHEAAKAWLMEDAKLLKEGKLDALPMGYLICGPVGTGKTYMMTCYAGTLGIPCVKLMNFRSQWQGVTEGNWEKILNTLKATGPVAVIIDEADAALGNRDNSGDSGTSSRVFSMLAQQMGDTLYRGKILWFLLTCRPDLLPIDLKRQGRAEVHIPLFYPESDDEKRNYFTILAKKNGGTLEPADVPADALKLQLSGADIEGLVVRAKRRALLAGSPNIRAEDLNTVLQNFMPPSNSDEIELQVLAATVECTHQDFLPAALRKLDRSDAVKRLGILKQQFKS